MYKKVDMDKKREELDRLKAKYGLGTPKHSWNFVVLNLYILHKESWSDFNVVDL